MQTQHGCCWFHAEVSLRYANSRSADAMEGIPLNSVRDCSDSLFAVCFKQQQLLQCRRKNVAPVGSNGKKLQAKSPTLLFYYHLQKQ